MFLFHAVIYLSLEAKNILRCILSQYFLITDDIAHTDKGFFMCARKGRGQNVHRSTFKVSVFTFGWNYLYDPFGKKVACHISYSETVNKIFSIIFSTAIYSHLKTNRAIVKLVYFLIPFSKMRMEICAGT